jgi:hypothetical protein
VHDRKWECKFPEVAGAFLVLLQARLPGLPFPSLCAVEALGEALGAMANNADPAFTVA